MPRANWDAFSRLPGAADENFEKLCRSLVRRHYGRFGRFKQRANQPGVEFHLQLTESCDLGEPPRWIGWQCKWYGLTNGEDLGAARRKSIIEGLEKTCKHVPEVTDWKLWTHHTLTKADQDWFFALENDRFTNLRLELLTATDVEDLLVGPGALLRETYFGELVLTPVLLAEQYRIAAAPFKHRYQQCVHVVVGAEDEIHRRLGIQRAWGSLESLAGAIKDNCASVLPLIGSLKVELREDVEALCSHAIDLAGVLSDLHAALGNGYFDTVQQMLAASPGKPARYDRLLSKLRGARSSLALLATNLVADIHAFWSELRSLKQSISLRAVAVIAAAGQGKSELAVRVTQPDAELLGGVLLLGKNLNAGQGLDDLVSSFKISSQSARSFDRLVEALDAAGQRAGKRIPIVIDGLNEAEDPRNWKDEIARAEELLQGFPYVFLIVTLRNEFAQMCLPEEFPQVEHNGFEEDPLSAIDRYLDYYKIDRADAELPIEFLQHPLTLRIFCEVANPRRQHMIGVEALPNSLAGLFDAHFNKVAERVAELSPIAHRIYQDEVQNALQMIAGLLWEKNARSVEFQVARKAIGDMGWDGSIIRALESEGVLVRTISETGAHAIAFSHDLMAGHIIARHLLVRPDLVLWLQSNEGNAQLLFHKAGSHTFAYDVFRALASLYPQRLERRQLWQDLLDESLINNALQLTAQSDPKSIGRETVERFARAMQESKSFAQSAFARLRITRAAKAHPFDMQFLDRVLLVMSNVKRDLFWSEWVRENSDDLYKDLKFLSARWRLGNLGEREILRARWVMWTLTSTSRSLRDVATKTLYEFAIKRPGDFFRLAVDSFSISDPYVPERVFAAAYGAALATCSDINAVEMREELPEFARKIYQAMFAPDAILFAWHALYQQYCLGTISIARTIDPACLSAEEVARLLPPLGNLPSPFDNMPEYDPAMIESAARAAIRMDFGNYTIGRLIAGRSNYDSSNQEYQRVLTAIVSRMLVLGYDPEKFDVADRKLISGSRMRSDKDKVDRYGKKYGWIAYFEMWGIRYSQGLLAEWRSARPSDADIDPTFPLAATSVDLPIPDLFSGQPLAPSGWIENGPKPDYRPILEIAEIGGLVGPWVLLDGFVEENAPADDRQVFTFLRGVFVDSGEIDRLQELFDSLEYPGNNAIPEPPSYYYTYAGEMPLSSIPGLPDADEQNCPECVVSADRWSGAGVKVEIPVQKYNWESYHSVVNHGSGASLPSKQLCKALGLGYRADSWDLHDASGVASIYREVGEYDSQINGSLSYLRRDLLDGYLMRSGKSLVWLMWGERGFHHRSIEVGEWSDHYSEHLHIHKSARTYRPVSLKE